jgi:NADH-quinone oxidoreductase subunit E
MLSGLPREVAGTVNLAAHPVASAMAFSAVGLGLWSQAFGVWMGTASAMAEMSLRAMSGVSPQEVNEAAIGTAPKPAGVRTEAAVKTMMADAAQVADAAVEVVSRVAVPEKRGAGKPSETAGLSMPMDFRQPKAIDKPRKADDLKAISGIGPKLESVLNGLGIWTYGQIAGWTAEEIAWVDDYLSFKGRIERDGWIGQAKALAKAGTKR